VSHKLGVELVDLEELAVEAGRGGGVESGIDGSTFFCGAATNARWEPAAIALKAWAVVPEMLRAGEDEIQEGFSRTAVGFDDSKAHRSTFEALRQRGNVAGEEIEMYRAEKG
jgi:hypothetical protein